jgi:hypothetical protein
MAIVDLPTGLKVVLPLTCSVCGVTLTLDKATAGLVDADGRQAFACVSHFLEVELLVRGWAVFVTDERKRYLDQGKEPKDLLYYQGANDAWLDC